MINFETSDDILNIKDFPSSNMSFQDLQNAFDNFKETITSQTKNIVIDLKNVSSTDYSILAFLISCGEFCHSKKMKITLENAVDEKLVQHLSSLGFEESGNYNYKDFRKEKPKSIYETIGDSVCVICSDAKKFVGFIGESSQAIYYLLRHPGKIDWNEVFFCVDKAGSDAVPIVSLICFLVGVILALQGLGQLAKFGLESYVADLVGLSMVRELGPLMVAMICIGRAGSSFAAELGTMKVNEELDAMKTMGFKPARFLVLPKIMALMIVMPMLTIIGDFIGVIGGTIVGVTLTDLSVVEYISRTINAMVPANIIESLLKSIVFAFLIAGVGCFRGFEADNDAKGVGKATTSSVVSGIFLVVIADFLITFIFPLIIGIFGVKY